VTDDRTWRRWIGWLVLAAGVAVAVWILPRVLPRSPLTILAACALGVFGMWLAERRLRAWLGRHAGR
jgi:4-hydroxybenzoate polyprenyltransferase